MPQPLQLVDFKGSPCLNEDTLTAVLNSPICRDRPVVVVSMAGDYRKGKSFMLNMFLKYLTFTSQAKNEGDKDWLADVEKPFEGFSSRGGLQRETTGILIWPEPFLMTLPSSEEVAVVVLDTQGTFDSQSTAAENTRIFALSTMISSIQVYNQFSNIQENDLQQLSLFVEYGTKAFGARTGSTSALKSVIEAPFQKLVLLLRDWRFEDDFPCDEAGSKGYLEYFLKVPPGQANELQVVRQQLRKSFSQLDCFLLPQPGPVVEKGKPLQSMSVLDPDFRRELRRFVPSLLSPDRVLVKTSSGRRLTGSQLADYIRTYCEVLFSDGLPSPTSMWRATAEVDHRQAMEEALHSFKGKMDAITGSEEPVDSDELNRRIMILKREAMVTYTQTPKMEDDDVREEFSNRLTASMDNLSLSYLKLNRSRRERAAQEATRLIAEARATKEEEARKAAEWAAAEERCQARYREDRMRRDQEDEMYRMRRENQNAIARMEAAEESARRSAEAWTANERERRMAATLAASKEQEKKICEQMEEMERMKAERQKKQDSRCKLM